MIQITFPTGVDSLTAKGLTQYDTGQRIEISGTGVTTETVQVHFAASGQSSAIIKPGTVVDSTITAEIPDSVLAMGRTVTAWAYVIDGDERETKYTVVLPVVSRVRPQDYISPAEPPYVTGNELLTDINALDGRLDTVEAVNAGTRLTAAESGLAARYTKTEADALLAKKITNLNTEWFEATLMNTATGYLRYRLNGLGNIEIKASVSQAVIGSSIVSLPAGFRVASDIRLPIITSDNTLGSALYRASGAINLSSSSLAGKLIDISATLSLT